jgi:hypothetical protein
MDRTPKLAWVLAVALAASVPVNCAANAPQQEQAAQTQDGHETDPSDALASALAAACRGNEGQLAVYFTADNAAAFRALPKDERAQLVRRFSLADEAGKPLLSSDDHNRTVLRCETPSTAVEFRFGDTRLHENLAFIPVTVANGQPAQFGLVRESGGWRIISLGLVLLDIPQLSHQWAQEDIADRENSIVLALQGLTEAITRYKTAFGKLPDSLAQLGPAPPGQISPDQASMVSKDLADGAAGGYHFQYRVISSADPKNQTFELAATPDDYGKTGRRSFLQDGAGRIHAADKHGATATTDDPALETDNADNSH